MKLLLVAGMLASLMLAVSTVAGASPFAFNSHRIIQLEVLGPNPGNLQIEQAGRLFRSVTTAETRNATPTENSSRRLYVVSDADYDVVDAVCFPGHGEADIVPLARNVGGSVVVVNAMVVEGSDAICSALGMKVR